MTLSRFQPRAIGNVHELALSLAGTGPGKILDAAAGDGYLSTKLRDRGFGVTSVDICNQSGQPNFIEADLNADLPFQAGSFDGVVSVETIEHLENPWHFVREIGRVVRPGGFVVLSTPNVGQLFSRVLFCTMGNLLWFQQRDLSPLGHLTPIHLHLLELMARQAGLEVSQKHYSWGRIPLLNVSLRFGSRLVGECVVVRLSKLDQASPA